MQETVKTVAFYLHDLLDVCEQAVQQIPPSEEVDKALEYVRGMISDFRIKDLKRR